MLARATPLTAVDLFIYFYLRQHNKEKERETSWNEHPVTVKTDRTATITTINRRSARSHSLAKLKNEERSKSLQRLNLSCHHEPDDAI